MKIGWVRNEKKAKTTGSLSLWSALNKPRIQDPRNIGITDAEICNWCWSQGRVACKL